MYSTPNGKIAVKCAFCGMMREVDSALGGLVTSCTACFKPLSIPRQPPDDGSGWYDLETDRIKKLRDSEVDQRLKMLREELARQQEARRRADNFEDAWQKAGESMREELKHNNPDAHFGKILGLKGAITRSDIKKCYRDLIAKYHPDRVHDLGPELRDLAEKKAKEINEAYAYFCRKYDI